MGLETERANVRAGCVNSSDYLPDAVVPASNSTASGLVSSGPNVRGMSVAPRADLVPTGQGGEVAYTGSTPVGHLT